MWKTLCPDPVFQSLDVIWLDKDMKVVDVKRVKPFTLNHRPKSKAKYVVELPVSNSKISEGDRISVSIS